MGRKVSVPPDLLIHFKEAVAALSVENIGLILDFDGTLSELVSLPDDAVIHPQVVEPLRRLADKLKFTAVMSGRAACDIRRRVGIDSIIYIGNHGAECIVDGALSVSADVCSTTSDMQMLLDRISALADDPAFVWENKGFSASIHYRMAADEADAIERLSSGLSAIPQIEDMEVFWGNKVLEIRHRNGVNKGTALNEVMCDWKLDSVVFLGDDTTDADALRLIRQRKSDGLASGLGVAVIQQGTPKSVLDNADYSLNGVAGVAEFLRRFDLYIG